MITNGDGTLWHRIYNKETRQDQWQAMPIYEVLWEENKGASPIKGGIEKENEITVYIPFEKNLELGSLLCVGDKIKKGLTNSMEQAVTILSIEIFDYGSSDMQHWEVKAQ